METENTTFRNHSGFRRQTMRLILLWIALLAGLLAFMSELVYSRPEPNAAPQRGEEKKLAHGKPNRAADEAAIRANVKEFVRAYNVGEAKAVAALFTPDGLIIDKEGNTSAGRAAIEKTFADIFAAAPQKRLEVFVESIRFMGPDLAVEVGSTTETSAPGEVPDHDRYTVLHVKRGGKWQMALARDAEGQPPTNHERLRPLAWLIGNWVDDGGNVVVSSTCRWSKDKNFLLQDFKLQVAGRQALQVTQRIGWDPVAKRIRSWVFDSEGGYGESLWTRNGDAWVIKASAVRPDGTTVSATNMLVPAGKDGYVWRSTDRIIGDEVESAIEVKVVRKSPQPKQ
jgi:uncharacterized protein (TIGR02246 family)